MSSQTYYEILREIRDLKLFLSGLSARLDAYEAAQNGTAPLAAKTSTPVTVRSVPSTVKTTSASTTASKPVATVPTSTATTPAPATVTVENKQ